MNEQTETGGEGSPAIEQTEKQILGNDAYQKAEVVHRFADTHPWFHRREYLLSDDPSA